MSDFERFLPAESMICFHRLGGRFVAINNMHKDA